MLTAAGATTVGCSSLSPHPEGAARYRSKDGGYTTTREWRSYSESGTASWYGPRHHGRRTANGERFDQHAYTAAHLRLPMNACVHVRNLENGSDVLVRINDRGPFVNGRIIDLSYAAASEIRMIGPGTARVSLEAVGEADASKYCPRGRSWLWDRLLAPLARLRRWLDPS